MDNQQHGFGVETWPDKSRFEGLYQEGQKEGFEKYYSGNGSIHIGNWSENK